MGLENVAFKIMGDSRLAQMNLTKREITQEAWTQKNNFGTDLRTFKLWPIDRFKGQKRLNAFGGIHWQSFVRVWPGNFWKEARDRIWRHWCLNKLSEKHLSKPRLRMFWKTACGVSSLNGGTPVRNSNKHTPSAHQSTGYPAKSTQRCAYYKNI